MNYKSSFSGFSTNDLAAAKEFYTNTLGLTLKSEEMGLGFDLPGGGQFFIYEKPDHQPATFTVLNLVVEDIEKAVADLKSKGVVFESYDEGIIKTDDQNIARGKVSGDGPDIAWFKDPAGNFLAILED